MRKLYRLVFSKAQICFIEKFTAVLLGYQLTEYLHFKLFFRHVYSCPFGKIRFRRNLTTLPAQLAAPRRKTADCYLFSSYFCSALILMRPLKFKVYG
jgi:hypothetical protein